MWNNCEYFYSGLIQFGCYLHSTLVSTNLTSFMVTQHFTGPQWRVIMSLLGYCSTPGRAQKSSTKKWVLRFFYYLAAKSLYTVKDFISTSVIIYQRWDNSDSGIGIGIGIDLFSSLMESESELNRLLIFQLESESESTCPELESIDSSPNRQWHIK